MFDSDILEVAIGLSMVFALVSTICTAVREWLESYLKTRASYLEYGIRQLLNDPHALGVAREVFDHPLVSGLYIGNYTNNGPPPPDSEPAKGPPPERRLNAKNKNLPSYIPAGNFAKALIDVVARGPASDVAAGLSTQPISFARFRGNLANIDNPHLHRALLSVLDSAEGDLNRLKAGIETWYDSAMDRVSGWYKRTTQKMLFIIAFVVVAVLNVNTITIADYLFRHDAERSAVVASIDAPAGGGDQQKLAIEQANARLNAMHLPIGWTGDTPAAGWGAPRTRGERAAIECAREPVDQAEGCLQRPRPVRMWEDFGAPLVGWLLTAFAATLGAPFWFDVLSKFMTVRSTLKPREQDKKKDAAASESASPPAAPAPPAALVAAAIAPVVAHEVDDHCGVGLDVTATTDDRLPAATGGVA